MKSIQLLLVLFSASLLAQAPEGVRVWTNQDVNSTISAMTASKRNHGSVSKVIGSFGNYLVELVQRNSSGIVEEHLTKNDIFFIRDGSATLILGGTVINGKSSAPNEIRGDSVQNGTKYTVRAGDIIHIPAKVPHQMLLAPGETVAYTVVKTAAQ